MAQENTPGAQASVQLLLDSLHLQMEDEELC